MGILKDLFCPDPIQLQPGMPQIATAMTNKNISDILSGYIQSIPVKRIVLKPGEECLFCDYAVLITEKLQVVGRQGNGGNFTFRIMKGMYYHTGNRGNTVIRDKVPEYVKGKLYITNKRVVFSADSKAFQHNLSSMISYREEDGCLILQFSNSSYRLYLPVVSCADKVIQYVI